MHQLISLSRRSPQATAALIVAVVGIATILGAYFFQYVLGYQPCPLCLEQRIAYYIAVPLALITAAAALNIVPGLNVPGVAVKGALALLALVMVASAVLAAYHAGVEWGWWKGPQDCSGPISGVGSASDLLRQMQTTSLVRCDEAPLRILGLSLAGYNVLISIVLAAIALRGVILPEGASAKQP
jgi:disulfide bond formation protein DsbB